MSFCYWRIHPGIDSANLGLLDLSTDAGSVSADRRRNSNYEEDSPRIVSADRRRNSNCEEDSPRIVSAARRYKAQPAITKPKILITCRLIRKRLCNRTYRWPADTTKGRGRALEKLGAQITASVLAARQYGGSCDITLELSIMDMLTNRFGMDTSLVEAFTSNEPSGRWTITRGRIVAMALTGLYFAGRGKVVVVTCRDLILVRIVLLESSPAIEGIKLPFSERGLELLSDCVRGTHLGGLVPATICFHDI